MNHPSSTGAGEATEVSAQETGDTAVSETRTSDTAVSETGTSDTAVSETRNSETTVSEIRTSESGYSEANAPVGVTDATSCSTPDAAHPRFNENKISMKMESLNFNDTVLKLALVQLRVTADKACNVGEAILSIRKAKEKGAHIVCLPEIFNSPYGTKHFPQYAEMIPSGYTSCYISCAAAQNDICVVAGSIPEVYNGRFYNTCTVWNNCGQLIAVHRKMHLFDINIPGQITFRESDVLSAGHKLTYFDYCGIRIGIGICYDIRFYEMTHLMAAQGCKLLIYPAAFNMTTGPKHWELLARARANDNQVWVAMVSPARNEEADYVAWGHSMVVSPWAEVTQKLDEKPGMILADIDICMVDDVRRKIPIREQRRTDVYETIAKCPPCCC